MRTKTEIFFIASISFLAACAALLPAISQDQSYHAFADRRSWGFIPNAQDTLTNLAFVIASTWGAWRLVSGRLLLPGPWMRLPLVVFLAGIFALLAADRVSVRASHWAVWAFVVLAPLTVLIWSYSGNLAPYVVLQFGGIFLVAALCLRPAVRAPGLNFLGLLIFYALAKIAEILDHQKFEFALELISGHSAKHVLAAMGVLALIRR
jgi:hypothetical protein